MTAVILERVKYPHNLAAAIRAAACFGGTEVLWTGKRFEFKDGERLPREERMKGYAHVEVLAIERWTDALPHDAWVVGIEITPTAQPLTGYWHWREKQVAYVFGPEDGGLSKSARGLCHEHVYIPSHHCLNLAAAVNVVLAHRFMQLISTGDQPLTTPATTERRGIIEVPGWEGR